MAQHALLMMWAVAWQQVPCGAMPADAALLRAKLKIPPKMWPPMADVVVRGWWLADDGRLYHDTITTRVREMLGHKDAERIRKAEYRARLDAERQARDAGNVPRDKRGTTKGQTTDGHGKDDTGTGTGTGTIDTSPGGDVGAANAASTAKPAAASRGKRLPQGWTLPKAWGDWSLAEYPHWTPDIVRLEALRFADHWHAQTGKSATKADWPATWRNWCRSDICQRAHPRSAATHASSGLSAAGSATLEASRSLEKKLFGEPA